MSEEHLDRALAEEFSGHGDVIHKLKLENSHFAKLLHQNHELWAEIHNIQTNVTPSSDEILEVLEKKRLLILDEIGAIIKAAE
ncbi:MAG: hypothetical protein FD163_1188 [Hyphomonadaceae bacterium]|nr:MAG: hypothetical protein FD128_1994 [Hyphomonadaceae bacterium]KAF0185373.1 MAG: hypothetical protein FD163_1188 [Hyphomonadaceae bacterium]